MASWFRPDELSDPQRASLLRWAPPDYTGVAPHQAEMMRVDNEVSACLPPQRSLLNERPPCAFPDYATEQPPLEVPFRGEFGYELLVALPQVYHQHQCGTLRATTACAGREPFYFFSEQHVVNNTCTQWQHSTKDGTPIGQRFTIRLGGWARGWQPTNPLHDMLPGQPRPMWRPPPLYEHYHPLPIEPDLRQSQSSFSWHGRGIVYIANSCAADSGRSGRPSRPLPRDASTLPIRAPWEVSLLRRRERGRAAPPTDHSPTSTKAGRGDSACPRLSLDEDVLAVVRDRLLACGKRIVYVPPMHGGRSDGGSRVFAAAASSGRALVLSPAHRTFGSAAAFNELLLRAASKASCFVAPGGGTSYLTFYMPGLHLVADVNGRERCRTSLCEAARREGLWNETHCPMTIAKLLAFARRRRVLKSHGTYFHHFARLSGADSVIYNAGDDRQRLLEGVELMCDSRPQIC